MAKLAAVAHLWDSVVAGFLQGEPPRPESVSGVSPQVIAKLNAWSEGYKPKDTPDGRVVWEAFAEPFVGGTTEPAGIFLGLNPGRAYLEFQGRDGIFAREIRDKYGSYTKWADSWPYLRDPWESQIGPNRFHRSRLRFLRDWLDNPSLPKERMLTLDLYPWHSTKVTAPIRVEPSIVKEFIWDPIADLNAPVFAFGAPWLKLLEEDHKLTIVKRFGLRGDGYGSRVASRCVLVLEAPGGVTVIAEKHNGSAGPPNREETLRLRDAVSRALALG